MALEAQGSNPCIHPTTVRYIFNGLSPSGKAQDFDSCITLVRIQLAQLEQTSAEVQSVFIIRFITFQNIVGY